MFYKNLLNTKAIKALENAKVDNAKDDNCISINIDNAIVDNGLAEAFGLSNVITDKKVCGQLENAGGKDIKFLINSPGGCVYTATAIINHIKEYQGKYANAKISAVCIGLAASAAANLFISFDKQNRKMYDNSLLMFHNLSSCFCGTADQMINFANVMTKVENVFLKRFKNIVGDTISEKQLKANLDADWYLDHNDAITHNIIESEDDTAEGDLWNYDSFTKILNIINNITNK